MNNVVLCWVLTISAQRQWRILPQLFLLSNRSCPNNVYVFFKLLHNIMPQWCQGNTTAKSFFVNKGRLKKITSSNKFECSPGHVIYQFLLQLLLPKDVILKMSVKWMKTGITDARWDANELKSLSESVLWKKSVTKIRQDKESSESIWKKKIQNHTRWTTKSSRRINATVTSNCHSWRGNWKQNSSLVW